MTDTSLEAVEALNWISTYIHNYCIIIHPKENTKGEEPELAIQKKIDEALAALRSQPAVITDERGGS